MTDTRTDQTRTDETSTDQTRADRTADEIVAERDAARAADDGARQLTTSDIASGRAAPGTPGNATGAAAADRAAPERSEGRDVDGERVAPLFDDAATTDLRDRWTDVQAGFVDEPRLAVEQADGLVAEVMQRLADSFATEREALEQQWSRGGDVSTEDLRVALRRYRSFFDRLLSF